MARAIVTAFLVTGVVAVVGVLLGTRGMVLEGWPPVLVIGSPIAIGWIAASRSPGTWPHRERPAWTAGVGLLVVIAGAFGLLLGGYVGLQLAFGMGFIFWGH